MFRSFLLGVLVIAPFLLSGCSSGKFSKTQQSSEQASSALEVVEPRAEELLKKMGNFLAAQKSFSVKAQIVRDEVLPTGERVQFGKSSKVTVVRPNMILAHTSGDERKGGVYFNGSDLTLVDTLNKHYATLETPASIDEVVALLIEEYGFSFPLADFVLKNPFSKLRKNLSSGRYLGESDIDGSTCHHLVFRQNDIDWQIWIEEGSQPYPRKFVITYKRERGVPQFGAVLQDWRQQVERSSQKFTFFPPKGFEKVELVPVSTS